MRQMTGMKAQKLGVKNWQKEGVDRVLQAEGTKPLREYTKIRQAEVSEWLALRPILKFCAKDTGYNGGGRLRDQW